MAIAFSLCYRFGAVIETKMTDKEILEIDFYDLCGCAALWMTDEDKIKYYKECMNVTSSTDR
jgi:hypothetical protein